MEIRYPNECEWHFHRREQKWWHFILAAASSNLLLKIGNLINFKVKQGEVLATLCCKRTLRRKRKFVWIRVKLLSNLSLSCSFFLPHEYSKMADTNEHVIPPFGSYLGLFWPRVFFGSPVGKPWAVVSSPFSLFSPMKALFRLSD